ncbi:MAG: D-2-hydroxyacid dehydrogenase [Bacteroidota bacterium]
MNIVVLDGFTLNPGDLQWNELQSLGKCTVHDRTLPGEIIERAKDAEIVLTNKVVLSREIIARLPNLKYIGVLATGYNVVDTAAAKEKNIVVTNVPAYSTISVAQTAFSLLLELTHHAGHHSDAVRNGKWNRSKDFTFRDFPLVELAEKKFGIIGFGNIGRAAARIASAFGMTVLVSTRTKKTDGEPVRFVDTETLFSESDVLSLHCPLTDETKHLVNRNTLALMKRTAFLINTSRGGLIDEPALAAALNAGTIAGAGLDVLSSEPPASDNPLLSATNCIITPHIAWASFEARKRLMAVAAGNVRSFIDGRPVNVVNPK